MFILFYLFIFVSKVRQGPKTADEQFREAMLGTKETEAVTKTTKLMALPDHEPDDFVKKMVPKNWTLSEADLDITTPKSTIFKDNYKLKVLSAKEEKELEILQEKLKPKTDHLGKVIEPSPADALARCTPPHPPPHSSSFAPSSSFLLLNPHFPPPHPPGTRWS